MGENKGTMTVRTTKTLSDTIYDVPGKRIRQLQLEPVTVGRYVAAGQAAYWDRKSETGEAIASGTYLLSTSGWDSTETRKMAILK